MDKRPIEHIYAKTSAEARSRGYWFKVKKYGYGWTPVTFQGWATTIAYALLLVGDVMRTIQIDKTSHSATDTLAPFILSVLLQSILFFAVTEAKGEPAKWRWGK